MYKKICYNFQINKKNRPRSVVRECIRSIKKSRSSLIASTVKFQYPGKVAVSEFVYVYVSFMTWDIIQLAVGISFDC